MPQDQENIVIDKKTQEQLKQLGVMTLYFFGSRAYGLANPTSDYDFGILTNDPKAVAQSSLKLYDHIYTILSEVISPENLEADVIDLVFLDSPRVSLELKHHIIRHGQLLLDVNPQERMAREEQYMLQQADLAPLRIEMSKTLLARI